MKTDMIWTEESVRHFMAGDSVGWIGAEGTLVPTPLHGHLDAFRGDARMRDLLPGGIDLSGDDRAVMDALYGAGWGRIGTWDAPGESFRQMELECFVEHLPALERHTAALASLVGRSISVSSVFTREDRLRFEMLSGKRSGKRRAMSLDSVARGKAVGWLSPEGTLDVCAPSNLIGFLRGDEPKPGLGGLVKWLKEADRLYETWQDGMDGPPARP